MLNTTGGFNNVDMIHSNMDVHVWSGYFSGYLGNPIYPVHMRGYQKVEIEET